MGKSTEPPTCRFCGKAHRGTCMDHEAKGAIASQRRVAVIGHIDHRKTSLTAAITKVLAENPVAFGVQYPRSGSSEVEQRPFKPTAEGSIPSPITNPRAKATRAEPSRQAQGAGTDGVASRPSRRGGSPASKPKRKPRMTNPTDKPAKPSRGRPKSKTPEQRKAYLAQKARERRAKKKSEQP